MSYKLALVIGRFQPLPHSGHFELFEAANKTADHTLIVVGSAFSAPSIRNPVPHQIRMKIIDRALTSRYNRDEFTLSFAQDYLYNDAQWVQQIQSTVRQWFETRNMTYNPKDVVVVGSDKDETTYYLRIFGFDFMHIPNNQDIDGTRVRDALFSNYTEFQNLIKSGKVHYADAWSLTDLWSISDEAAMVDEYLLVKAYKESWNNAPYAPTFVTTDAVVVCNGHILMVKRSASTGKGQYALPGGFLEQNIKIFDNCIKELYEETNIGVPEKVMRGSLVSSEVFDHPLRSTRGRTITHAYIFNLVGENRLPKIKGCPTETYGARWISFAEIIENSHKIFEDHFSIIETLRSRIK
jgi:bifunctional NMN adenylyltransferase/nudix hydrolase